MCWAGMIDGRMILHWFDIGATVTGQVYLDMLQKVVWPAIKYTATRRDYWFQQDGATPHTTVPVRAYLEKKFGDRVISRNMNHPWPAKSPNLSPLDFYFWSVAMTKLRNHQPKTLNELKEIVDSFAESLDEDELKKVARSVKGRAKAYKEARCGAFEYRMK